MSDSLLGDLHQAEYLAPGSRYPIQISVITVGIQHIYKNVNLIKSSGMDSNKLGVAHESGNVHRVAWGGGEKWNVERRN